MRSRPRRTAAAPPAPRARPSGLEAAPSGGAPLLGGGGASVVPGSGAAVTAIVGVDSTVKPSGIRSDAAEASASAGPKLLCAASAAASDVDSIVSSSSTDAAVTLRETWLSATPADEAKLVTMLACTSAV